MSDILLVPVNFEEGHDRQVHMEIHNTGPQRVVRCVAQIVLLRGDTHDARFVDVIDPGGSIELARLGPTSLCEDVIESGSFGVVEVARLEPSGTVKFRSKDKILSVHMIKQDIIELQIKVDVEYSNGESITEILSGTLVREYDPYDNGKQHLVWNESPFSRTG